MAKRLSRRNQQRLKKALFLFWKQLPKRFQGKFGVMLFSLIGILLFAFFEEPPARATDSAFPKSTLRTNCVLERVLDGDTLTAECDGRYLKIRLSGIDAPETGQAPWGAQATEALARLMPKNFQMQSQGTDVYQRQLGILYDGTRDLNLEMIQKGQAVAYRHSDTPKHYYAAEQEAKRQKIGIWSKPGHQQDPKRWRRENL